MINQNALKILCLALFKNDSILIYEIHQKYRLPIGELATTLGYLKKKKLISIEGLQIQVTNRFKPWAFKNRAHLFLTPGPMSWKSIDDFKISEL